MKLFFIVVLLVFTTVSSAAQSSLQKGNTCYDAKNYPCAIDNYLQSLSDKSFAAGDQYLVEYRIGYGYLITKQYDKALDFFKRCAASKPDYIDGFWGQGDCYYRTGKYNDAVENYRKAYTLATDAEDKDDLSWWTGESYFALKRHNDAIAEFKKIGSRSGILYKVDAAIGDEFFNLTSYDSAMKYYTKSLETVKPTDEIYNGVRCFIGKCYRLTGKPEKAMEQFDAILATAPKHGLSLWEKGILYANKNDYETAIGLYKKAQEVYINDTSYSYSLCGNIAACYQSLKNHAEELNWQQKRKSYSGNKYIEYSKIATIQYGRLKQQAAAEKTCTEAINNYQLEPETVKTKAQADYIILNGIAGKIALEKKDTAQAQKYFDAALKLSSTNFLSNAGAGEIAWAGKRVEEYKKYYTNISKYGYDTLFSSKKEIANVFARAAYVDAYVNKSGVFAYSLNVNTALSFDSLQKEAVLLWPRVLSSSDYSYLLNTKRDACLSVLNKAVKQYAADKQYVSDLYNAKAVITVTTDTASIRKSLEEAIRIYPDNMSPWDNLLIFYSSHDNAAGVVLADKLIALLKKKKDNATTAAAYVYKGDFLWRLNKKDEAKIAYQEALVWDAGNATAKERSKMQ